MRRFNKPKLGRVKKPARQGRRAAYRRKGLGLQGLKGAATRSVRSSGDGESVGEFVKRFPELQAEDIKNILRGVGLLVEYQLHQRSLTLRAIKWGAPQGHAAAVTAVEQSSAIGKDI